MAKKIAFLCAPAALLVKLLYCSCIDLMITTLICDLTTLQRLTITRCAVIAEKQFLFFRHGDQAVRAHTPTPPMLARSPRCDTLIGHSKTQYVLARRSKSQKGQFHVYIVERRWQELLARVRWAYTPRLREQKCHGKNVQMDLSKICLSMRPCCFAYEVIVLLVY